MHTTPPILFNHHFNGPATPRPFDKDKLSFLRHVKNIGRLYRKQAVELVSICRTFVEAQDQGQAPNSYYELRSVLETVDEALMSAADAGQKTSKKADETLERAVRKSGDYERKYHPRKMETVAERIEKADKSSSKALNILMEKFRPLEPEPTTRVDFLIHKSLPDNNPTVVTQWLSSNSNLTEILWNLSRYRNKENNKSLLSVKQNPHFYEELPPSPENYGDKFSWEPIETYLHKRISVLTDNLGHAGRVFLKTAKKSRAFGNVWVPKKALIFKDVQGKLEGERIVGKDIQETPNLWCFTETPPSHTSPSSPSLNWGRQSPTTTATPTTCSAGLLLTGWTEPIRQMLRSKFPDVNIRISTNSPTNSIPSPLTPSSLTTQPGFSSSVGSLPRSSELPPAELSPRPPAHLSPEPPLPSHPMALPAHSTEVPSRSPARPSAKSPLPSRLTAVPAHTSPEPPLPFQPTAVPAPSTRVTSRPSRSPAEPTLPQPMAGSAPNIIPLRPTVQIPEPPIRKKNWFQRHIWDYEK